MKYEHIIWDWNGTILNDRWLCVAIMNEMLGPRGMPLMDEQRYRETFGFPIRDYYIRLGFDFEVESFEKVAWEFMDRYRRRQSECDLHPGAAGTLRNCADLAIGQSLLSAMEQKLLGEMLQRFGFTPYFETIAGLSDDFASSKTEAGRHHLAELNLEPERILFVGDTLHDYEVAHEIGSAVVLLANGHHNRKRLEKTGALVLSSLTEVPDYVTGARRT